MNLQTLKDGYRACGSRSALLSLLAPGWIFGALTITAPTLPAAALYLLGLVCLGLVAWMCLVDLVEHADYSEPSGRCVPHTRHRLSWSNIRDGAHLLRVTGHPMSGLGYMAVYSLLIVAGIAFPHSPFATTSAYLVTLPAVGLSALYVTLAVREANRVGAEADMNTLVLETPTGPEGNTH